MHGQPNATTVGDTVGPLPLAVPGRPPAVDTRLPLPPLPEPGRPSGAVYALARIDASGRIADHTTPTALHWHPGDPLTATLQPGPSITVLADPHGPLTLTAKRHVTLPAPLRRASGIHTGDLVFLAALPHHHVLLIHPLSYLDTLYTGSRS